MIKCYFYIGSPEILIPTEFVVIKALPFSCISGQKTLQTFSTWEISKRNKIMTINNSLFRATSLIYAIIN